RIVEKSATTEDTGGFTGGHGVLLAQDRSVPSPCFRALRVRAFQGRLSDLPFLDTHRPLPLRGDLEAQAGRRDRRGCQPVVAVLGDPECVGGGHGLPLVAVAVKETP